MDQLNADVRLALERAARGVDHVEDKRQQVDDPPQTGGSGGKVPDASTTNAVDELSTATNPLREGTSTSTAVRNGVQNNPTQTNAASSTVGNASTAISTATNVSATKSSKSSGGGGGGISTGAIVGIVVGVVGGLLVIGGIAFFILRKRRRSKDLSGGYDGTDATGNFMVDKETQGRATDSPNSPYTDENQTQNIPIENSARDLPPHVGVPRTSTGGSHDERALSSRAETPQGVSSNVAHLVEDGMTAEEIRRLEEEERQLDDEIERAARR